MSFFIFVFIPSVLANSDLPVAEIFVLAGFILIYVVEEFGHWALVRLVAGKNFGRFWTFKEHKIQTNISCRTGHISGDSGGHGHSHDVAIPVEESIQATARGFLVVLALSIHDFFEGIALGVGSPGWFSYHPSFTVKVSRTTSGVYFLLLAFATHKWVISGTMGLNWARSKILPLVALLYMTVFCAISPIGVAVGMAIKEVISLPNSKSK